MDIFKKYETPQRTTKFRIALIEQRGLRCEKCGLTEWLGKPINIELHHIDGDKSNNKLENLQLLCPNCHPYTDNYGSKNKSSIIIADEDLIAQLQQSSSIRQALLDLGMSDAGANYTRARKLIRENNISLVKSYKIKEKFCIDCGKPIDPDATRCVECAGKNKQVFDISREELKHLIRTTPFTVIGRQFGVSDNAIRKRCEKYNLPRKTSDIKKISDEEWEKI